VETTQNYTDLYADPTIIGKRLDTYGVRSNLSELITTKPVVNAFSLINCLAILHDMFPYCGPFNPFKFCKLKDLNGIIVGGLPSDKSAESLASWTGSAYCSIDSNSVVNSNLQIAIALNEHSSVHRTWGLSNDMSKLQTNGIMLIPEVLSTYVGGNEVMKKAWEPFIWSFLSNIAVLDERLPILFVTESAEENFTSAVEGSRYVNSMYIDDENDRRTSPALGQMEHYITENGARYFNFYKLAQK